jgi:hypothetical protein
VTLKPRRAPGHLGRTEPSDDLAHRLRAGKVAQTPDVPDCGRSVLFDAVRDAVVAWRMTVQLPPMLWVPNNHRLP